MHSCPDADGGVGASSGTRVVWREDCDALLSKGVSAPYKFSFSEGQSTRVGQEDWFEEQEYSVMLWLILGG